MVSEKLLGLADLSGAQTLCIHKTTEVIMVRKDENLMLAAFQIVMPRYECFNDSQKLIVVGLISSLGRNHFPRKGSYWITLTQIDLSDYPIMTSSGS